MVKNSLIYIEHILEATRKIFRYTEAINQHDFVADELIQDAVIRNFEIIGKATKRVSMDFRENNPDIPWRKMAGMRDFLIHDYLGIDIFSV